MGRRLLLVNVMFLVGIILLARYVTNAWHDFDDTQTIQSVLAGANNGRPKEITVKAPSPPEPPLPYPDFTVISEKDLFMPDRRPAQVQTEVVAEKPPPLPKPPSLNGVLNNSGKKQALLTIFEGNNPKGSSRLVSVGDDVQGYTVSEIADTTMKMRWKDHEILVDMFDSTPQQQAAAPAGRTAAVTMITIGSAAAPVETVTAEAVAEERRGIEVGVAGTQGGAAGQRGPGQGVRQGDRGQGQMGGRGTLGGRGTTGGASGGASGVLGFPSGGSGSVPFNSGTRRQNVR